MKHKIITLTIVFSIIALFFSQKKEKEPTVDFYDVQFLRNPTAVQKALRHDGFFEVTMQTEDNLTIHGLMINQNNRHTIQATIISFPGFLPGNKEGMTTLYEMLKDKPYNFIFIDSRGHGKSQGELLTIKGIQTYGDFQYLDMLATIKYINTYNAQHNIKQDIIIHGLCSGAFHSIKAVAHLKETNRKLYENIKGIVVDSGWPAIVDIAETAIAADVAARCSAYHLPCMQPILTYLIINLYRYLFKPHHATQMPITKIITTIDQPILFIHAQDDQFIPADQVHKLITAAKYPHSWFVADSAHVANHIKHKDAYQKKLDEFIQIHLAKI